MRTKKRISEFADPYREWVVVAEFLLALDRDATMFDLIKVMYEWKTSCPFPEMPDEDVVLSLFDSGMSPVNIARNLDTESGVVRAILESCKRI